MRGNANRADFTTQNRSRKSTPPCNAQRHTVVKGVNLLTMDRALSCSLLLLVFFIGSAGCKKSNAGTESNTTNSTQLIGSWNWVMTYNNGISSGNFAGNPFGDTSTPASTGVQQLLTFTTYGSWNLTQNNAPFEQGTFKIDTLFSPGGPIAMLDLIQIGGADSIVNHVLRNDTLILSNPHIVTVGRNWVYIRNTGKTEAQSATTPH